MTRIKILYIAITILVVLFQNAQAEFRDCKSLEDFIDNVTIGSTRNEVIKNFASVSPEPNKLTEHSYGSLCVIDNETVLFGIFIFFSDKLATSQALIMSVNNKVIDNAYDFAKNMLNNSNITDKPICPTVDMCTWKYYEIDYSISIGRTHRKTNNEELSIFVESRRKDSLVYNSNVAKSEFKDEIMQASDKLFVNIPSGHKLSKFF